VELEIEVWRVLAAVLPSTSLDGSLFSRVWVQEFALRIVIATGRQAHYRMAANSFVRRGHSVSLYTATPRSKMRGFLPEVANRFIPAPVALFNGLTRIGTHLVLDELDSTFFDRWAAMALEPCDLLIGAASSSLATGLAAKRMGATYVLDRACPDIRVQQAVMVEEARKAGATFRTNSPWFVERQVAEYEAANMILSPSDYSRRSFPEHLRSKIVLAPLYGRSKVAARVPKPAGAPFVVGVVGGQPLRKGYLYLLQAWQELALPNARLKIRSSADLNEYPVIAQLLASLPNVQIIDYVPDISEFYRDCDAFILPSVDDGFGMALFEAVANGVPSIATHCCGASELLEAERDCLLIDAFSVDQIKEAILRLYRSPELRERLSVNGPSAVAALQEGEIIRPYEAGIDELLRRVAAAKLVGAGVSV
jgi:glycosyltransferase involved in cell wall biosynthesis